MNNKFIVMFSVAVFQMAASNLALSQHEGLVTVESFENLTPGNCPNLFPPQIIDSENAVRYELGLLNIALPGQTNATKNCIFDTTLKVADGYRIKAKKITFGGQATLSDGSFGIATASYSSLGTAGPQGSTGIISSPGQPFVVSSPDDNATAWSACGGELTVRARADAILLPNSTSAVPNIMSIANAAADYAIEYLCVPCP